MGDEQHGEAEPLLQLEQEIDDLGLYRDVEGRDQLVGDQAFGLYGEGTRNADALALAAAELIGVAGLRIGRQAHQIEELADALLHPGALAQAMEADRLG